MFILDRSEFERVEKLHEESIVFDAQAKDPDVFSNIITNTMNELLDKGVSFAEVAAKMDELRWVNPDQETHDMYANAWKSSGVDALCITLGVLFDGDIFNIYRHGDVPESWSFAVALRTIQTYTIKFEKTYKDVIQKATSTEDILNAQKNGKHAILFKFQNSLHIGNHLDNLDFFYGLGLRGMQLTYNSQNLVGTGCMERHDSGLTNFGVSVVERMNKLGIVVDLSHCGYQTTMDAIEVSKEPVAFTHTFCKEVNDHPRAKTDEEIHALIEKGGVMGVLCVPGFISKSDPSLEVVVNHIDYAVDLVGVDHVGIGTDTGYGYPGGYPERYRNGRVNYQSEINLWKKGLISSTTAKTKGFEDWSKWPNITKALVSRGYSDIEIKKIIGLNWMQFWKKIID
jgi:membrane dipeptidase